MNSNEIETGKTYLTRSGRRVRVLCTDRNCVAYSVVGLSADGEVISYTAGGRYHIGETESKDDLMREAPATVTLHLFRAPRGRVHAGETNEARVHRGYIKTIEVEL